MRQFSITTVNCHVDSHLLAHRLERVFKAAIRKFPKLKELDTYLNGVYSFYSRSSKRLIDLDDTMEAEGFKKFRLAHVIDTRW